MAIGDQVLDLAALHALGVFQGAAAQALAACAGPALNALMAQGQAASGALRAALSAALCGGVAAGAAAAGTAGAAAAAEYRVPADIGDFTDFYASIHHATAVGRLFRPDNPLLPNYKWVPIAYHGRASSVRVSGFGVHRPLGQLMPPGALQTDPRSLAAPGLRGRGRRVSWDAGTSSAAACRCQQAEAHVFGLCLLNDWSARDIQAWEYQPLGPFLAKNFATTVSPWVVTLEALAPFRVPWMRPPQEPAPLAYLDDAATRRRRAYRHAARGLARQRPHARRRRAAAASLACDVPRLLVDTGRRCWRTTRSTAAT